MNSHIEKNYDIDTKPLKYFLYYLLLGFCIFLAGITGVFASEYNFDSFTAKFYDNNGSSLTALSTEKDDVLGYLSQKVYMTANSTGAGVLIISPSPFISGHSYSISLSMQTYGNNALVSNRFTFSSINRIAISNNESGVLTNYINNNTYATISYSNKTNDMLQFVFKANGNGNYIFIPFATTVSATYQFGIKTFVVDDLGNSPTQNDINNSLNSQTNIINNSITAGINDVKDEVNNVKDEINNNFNDCHDSVNLFDLSSLNAVKFWGASGVVNGNDLSVKITSNENATHRAVFYTFSDKNLYGKTITISTDLINSSTNNGRLCLFWANGSNYTTELTCIYSTSTPKTISIPASPPSGSSNLLLGFYVTTNNVASNGMYTTFKNIQIEEGTLKTSYEKFGEKICSNKIDDTNKKLDEAENTRKGILGTLKGIFTDLGNLPKKISDFITDALKSLFVPSDDFFINWWESFTSFFKKKLGFLTSPFEIFIDFIGAYLNLNSDSNIIINIPEITVPNFEEYVIISAQSFNWSELLNSKDSLKFLWNLYLDFIDVFIILNFIALCENTYNRIFGGDTSNYEYYTTEISYNVDNNTGEVVGNPRYRERKTTRKKVDSK